MVILGAGCAGPAAAPAAVTSPVARPRAVGALIGSSASPGVVARAAPSSMTLGVPDEPLDASTLLPASYAAM